MQKVFLILVIFYHLSNICFANNFPVKISEIMANPEGKDQGKEWIELYNTSDKKIDLSKLYIQIDDKSFAINQNINPKSHLKITSPLSLKNTTNSVQLIYEDQVLEVVNYSKPKENLSYSHVIIKNSDKQKASWQNTTPTPGSQNQILYELSGWISKEPSIAKKYYFEINGKQKIIFDNTNFKFNDLSASLKIGTYIEIQANKKNEQYYLQQYRLKSFKEESTTKKESNHTITLLSIAALLLLLIKKSSI